jgi:hypothetical protein
MACKEVQGITDNQDGVVALFQGPEGQEHPPASNDRPIFSGRSHPLGATRVKFREPSLLSAKEKVEPLTAFREQPAHRSRVVVTRRREIASVVVRVAILVAIIWFVKTGMMGTTSTQRYEDYAVDFSNQAALQSQVLPSKVPPAAMPRGRLDLAANLGMGSQPGFYDVVLTRAGTTYSVASGAAKLENGKPVLRVKLDVTQAPPGHFLLGVRSDGWDWKYYKVLLTSARWVRD